MSISERIFTLLSDQGKTQTAFAKYLGVRVATVSSWKARNIDPSADLLGKIAGFLGVSVDYLCTGKEFTAEPLTAERHIGLLLFIKREEYASVAIMPQNLLGDHDVFADTYAAVVYLEECDFIKQVPDVDVPADKRHGNSATYRLTERGIAYVERYCGGDTANVVRKQGIFGDGNHHNAVTIGGDGATALSEFERELLRIYATLDARSKNALLSYAYDLERGAGDK